MKKIILFLIILTPVLVFSQDYLDSLLLQAAYNGDDQKIKAFIEKGADPNAKVPFSNITPLMYMTDYGDSATVLFLLKKGADPDIVPFEAPTALQTAIAKGYNDIVKMLLDYGANPDLSDSYDKSPVFYAIENKNYEALELLFQYGATREVNEEFEYAAKNCDTISMWIMLDYGFDVNSDAWCALTAKNKCLNGMKLLCDYGADPNYPDTKSKTPVFYASLFSDENMLDLLKNNGAQIDEKTILYTLVYYNRSLLKKYKKEQKFKILYPVFGRFTFTPFAVGFSGNDLLFSFNTSLSDIIYNFGFRFGTAIRLWPKRIFYMQKPHNYLQLWEKRYVFYLNFEKSFNLKYFLAAPGIMTYYNVITYRGYYLQDKEKVKVIPSVSLFKNFGNYNLKFDYFYWKQNGAFSSPHYIFISFEFILPLIK